MEFTVSKSSLLSALKSASGVASTSKTMPVLANVLIGCNGNVVTCSATDMIVSISRMIDVEAKGDGGVMLSARKMAEVVSSMPAGDLRLKHQDNGMLHISAGKSSVKILTLPREDFPIIVADPNDDDPAVWKVSPGLLSSAFDHTAFSISDNEARPNLNGALLESDGETITVVSTDGHRLTKVSVPLAGPKLKNGIIIPRKGIAEFRKALAREADDVTLTIRDGFAEITTADSVLSARLTRVTFPPYNAVIPKSSTRTAAVVRSSLLDALRRAEVMAPEKTSTVRLRLTGGKLELTADNPEVGVAHQELSVEYSGDELVAGFNARFIIDALDVLDSDEVVMEFQTELDPCVIRHKESGTDYTAVVMPMRI